MAQIDESQFYVCGVNNNMINYRGELFSRHMPLELIEYFIENGCCVNCKMFASWNGCIIGLCVNCANYNSITNGCGFIDIGVELNSNYPESANNTYLKNVNWEGLGDVELDILRPEIKKEQVFEIIQNSVYVIDRIELPYTCVFFSKYSEDGEHTEVNKEDDDEETEEDRNQRYKIFYEEALVRYKNQELLLAKEEEEEEEEELINYELEEEEELINYELEEDEEAIEVFLTENGKESKWFEMKIQEYDEEHICDEEVELIQKEKEVNPILKVNNCKDSSQSTFYERFEESKKKISYSFLKLH